jgi:23S rRNA (cytidine2498-2'-O)-methyltransferase
MSCQIGAEKPCKEQIANRWPDFRLSFSRPGFLTYKVPAELSKNVDLQNTFARTYGFGVDRLEAPLLEDRVARLCEMAREGNFKHIHIWQRDLRTVGESFEPFESELTAEVAKAVRQQLKATPVEGKRPPRVNATAGVGQQVLDCIIVDPERWWVGKHSVTATFHAWPGGVPGLTRNPDAISRTYYKVLEALHWSRLPVRAGDICAEIGSSPGGAVQALLECEMKVIGIDPAAMDPRVAEHPNFQHLRRRGRDVARKDFADVRWLFCDSNAAPQQTLDTLEEIVKHPSVSIRGLLLTLKLVEWTDAQELQSYLSRIRSWGYKYVKPRHLAFNRQEICVAAIKNRGMIRAAGR